MENEPELIRDQMQETRTALTEKLDTLQQKVADTVDSITTPVVETVQTVKEAVSDTVDTVKETASATVDTVKETFNISRHVEQHPWSCVLGSVAAGFILGKLLPSASTVAHSFRMGADGMTAGMSEPPQRLHNGIHKAPEREEPEPAEEGKGLLGGLAEAFEGELGKLKGLGVSVGVGLLRDLMTQSVTGEIGDRVKEWMNGLTESLGGKPLTQPLVSTEEPDEAPAGREARKGAEGRPASSGKAKAGLESRPRW